MTAKGGPRADAILPMTDDYMQQIVRGEKNYEFRKYRINASVKRIWFYLNAPHSHVAYICEIDPAHTREPGDAPLVEDGLGNKEFNERHKDWNGYDYAYRVRSVYRIKDPISLADLRTKYGVKSAPRGLVYTPDSLCTAIPWRRQELIWPHDLGDAKVDKSLKRKPEDDVGVKDSPGVKKSKSHDAS